MVFTRNVDVKQCGEKNCRSLSGNTLLSFRDNARGRSTISRPLKRQQSPAAAASAKHPDILFSMASEFNDVLVLEFPQPFPGFPPLAGSRALMIDQNRDIHSVYREDQVLLGKEFYWEHLAITAAAAPEGPIGILGLGTGTVPRIIHKYWPDRKMYGWELDGVVLHAGRQHMGMKALEDAGALVSQAGDALAPEASIEGGFAGLIVDLFSAGKAIEPLHHEEVWQAIRQKLRPGGVCVANLGKTGEAAECMLATFADVATYIKNCGSNLLVCAGGDPSHPLGAIHPDLSHISEDWQQN